MTSRCFSPLNSVRFKANSHPSSPMTFSRILSRSSTVAGPPSSLKFCGRKPMSTAPRDVEQSGVVSEDEDHPQITAGTTAWVDRLRDGDHRIEQERIDGAGASADDRR
jgi:hypothetical protein